MRCAIGLCAGFIACASTPVRFVSSQRVDLVGVHGTLGEARHCRRAPEGDPVIRRKDVEAAGCRTRRYAGTIDVVTIGADGQRRGVRQIEVQDGSFSVMFAELDRGASTPWRAVEVGEGGWAARISGERLEAVRTREHARSVALGRGAPALFVAAHPDHTLAMELWALAVEARLARQEHDYLEVAWGQLAPSRFLRRHPWSPYRESVLGMLERVARAEDSSCSTCTR